MRGILVLRVLSVRSSYARDVEEPVLVAEVPDTVQWWISESQTWRIRTYAMDHDIHTHDVGVRSDILELALANNAKNYSDVTAFERVLEFDDVDDRRKVCEVLERANLVCRLEVAPGRFAFWKPDDAKYTSKSSPK